MSRVGGDDENGGSNTGETNCEDRTASRLPDTSFPSDENPFKRLLVQDVLDCCLRHIRRHCYCFVDLVFSRSSSLSLPISKLFLIWRMEELNDDGLSAGSSGLVQFVGFFGFRFTKSESRFWFSYIFHSSLKPVFDLRRPEENGMGISEEKAKLELFLDWLQVEQCHLCFLLLLVSYWVSDANFR